jgi:hypothetical protein
MAPLEQLETRDTKEPVMQTVDSLTKKPKTCGERHPVLCIDPEGEIPLRCGLPKGHYGDHQDERTVGSAEPEKTGAAP